MGREKMDINSGVDHYMSLEESLRRHGEAFLSMFEDEPQDELSRPVPSIGGHDGEPGTRSVLMDEKEEEEGLNQNKKKKRKSGKKGSGKESSPAAPRPTKSRSKQAKNDDVDYIFSAVGSKNYEEKHEKEAQAGDGKGTMAAKLAKGSDVAGRARQDDWLRMKIERKRFLSSKSDAILSMNDEEKLAEAKRRIEKTRSSDVFDKKKEMEEFLTIRREIQSFGT
jgi:hypothetical protein